MHSSIVWQSPLGKGDNPLWYSILLCNTNARFVLDTQAPTTCMCRCTHMLNTKKLLKKVMWSCDSVP